MLMHIVLLCFSALLIYYACELFVNGIEWTGRRFGVAQGAVGTVLAAFGTALPESVVTFVAVVFGDHPAQKEIGIGAALGGPLALSTIAYAVVGWTLWLSRPRPAAPLAMDARRLSRDQGWFLLIFTAKIALGLVVFSFKPWLGITFLLAYAGYFLYEIRREETAEEEALEPLKFRPQDKNPSTAWILLQTLLALSAIFLASQLFVRQLEPIGLSLGMPPQLIALLLSPLATELPETLNAVIWVRQGKERLALGNISGSMMVQATVPSALGLLFTPWLFDGALLAAGGVTMLAIVSNYWMVRSGRLTVKRLSLLGLFYLLFAAVLIML